MPVLCADTFLCVISDVKFPRVFLSQSVCLCCHLPSLFFCQPPASKATNSPSHRPEAKALLSPASPSSPYTGSYICPFCPLCHHSTHPNCHLRSLPSWLPSILCLSAKSSLSHCHAGAFSPCSVILQSIFPEDRDEGQMCSVWIFTISMG